MIIFNQRTEPFSTGSPFSINDYTNFDSFGNSLLVLFQIVTQSNWTVFIYDYAYKFGFIQASIFFCTFHLLTILFMMSLLRGLLWETFYVVDKSLCEEESDPHESHKEAQNIESTD